MACMMETLPDMAARCSGVEPAGAATSETMSRLTVRTIMEAPLSSSSLTHSRVPLKAAKWSAVSPFSALLSMYLQANQKDAWAFIAWKSVRVQSARTHLCTDKCSHTPLVAGCMLTTLIKHTC